MGFTIITIKIPAFSTFLGLRDTFVTSNIRSSISSINSLVNGFPDIFFLNSSNVALLGPTISFHNSRRCRHSDSELSFNPPNG